MNDRWANAIEYETFMGRWSNLIAKKFLDWLSVPNESIWLDIGCGTGTLTKLILEKCKPKEIIAIDQSGDFISYSQNLINNPNVKFKVGLAESLEVETNTIDVCVSGLVLNFVQDPKVASAEMLRVTRPGGRVGVFLWDYAEGMQMLRYFWNAAVELDNRASEFDEGLRFPICNKGHLESIFKEVGFRHVEEKAIEVKTIFKNFNDYWKPFLSNFGPAPGYVMNLNVEDREKLEAKLRKTLPIDKNGVISLSAKAWAVKGIA
jgi:ubiquinone/menaquinone biosynthesis C-methylase UbiE